MAMRPPSNDTSDASVIEFGIAAVDARLDADEVDYPISAEELRSRFGQLEIAYDTRGRTISLGEAIERTEKHRFEDEQDLLNALYPVFDELRSGREGGVVGRVRSLLPF
ncbi:hypothetical protein [Haloarchaeobius sp. TZWWS8]|uniref:DUF5789 family protein n=1 Tax=Haloarchaeobius sp. TZWWS8 TaxID=3446121 RepID=UPI003EBEFD53